MTVDGLWLLWLAAGLAVPYLAEPKRKRAPHLRRVRQMVGRLVEGRASGSGASR
jgi:hypothetical protein